MFSIGGFVGLKLSTPRQVQYVDGLVWRDLWAGGVIRYLPGPPEANSASTPDGGGTLLPWFVFPVSPENDKENSRSSSSTSGRHDRGTVRSRQPASYSKQGQLSTLSTSDQTTWLNDDATTVRTTSLNDDVTTVVYKLWKTKKSFDDRDLLGFHEFDVSIAHLRSDHYRLALDSSGDGSELRDGDTGRVGAHPTTAAATATKPIPHYYSEFQGFRPTGHRRALAGRWFPWHKGRAVPNTESTSNSCHRHGDILFK